MLYLLLLLKERIAKKNHLPAIVVIIDLTTFF